MLTTQTAVAAAMTVTGTADVLANDGVCTLREAITNANNDNQSGSTDCLAGSGTDTITLPAGIYTLTRAGFNEDANSTGDLDIRSNLNIVGAGAGSTIIQAGTTPLNGIDRVFEVVFAGNVATISGVTIRHGRTAGGFPSANGGAIFTRGTLTVLNTLVTRNTAISSGGAIYNYISGALTVVNSAITVNTAAGDSGAIQTDSAAGQATSVTIVNSTISGNTSTASGAMLLANNSGIPATVTIRNATFANNTGGSPGAINNPTGGTVTVQNSIFTNNSGVDCNGTFASGTANRIDDASCGASAGNLGPVSGLDTVARDNGGGVHTHALLFGSNAIDAGAGACPDATAAPLSTDARGVARPQGAACDIGAYEADVNAFAVTTAAEAGAGSLRQAITDANANANLPGGADKILFSIPGAGEQNISLLTPLPVLSEAVVIDGYTQPGASPNTLVSGTDTVMLIALTVFAPPIDYGLQIAANGVTVRGLSIGSFNTAGIFVDNVANTVIAGNHIGVTPDGFLTLPNGACLGCGSGILVAAAPPNGTANTVIGGAAPADRNVIAANLGEGITVRDGATGTVIRGNFIGLAADGVTPMGNTTGIAVRDGASNTQIGGIGAGEGNTIASNVSTGVLMLSGTGNSIRGNRIFDNPVNLNSTAGVPVASLPLVIHRIADISPTTHIIGDVSGAPGAAYVIDLYQNPDCSAVEARAYLGTVSATADAGGSAAFVFKSTALLPATAGVRAIVTDAAGNSSTLSACPASSTVQNDTWFLAAPLTPAPTDSEATVIYEEGQNRWYWFPVSPGGKVRVTVTGAPGTTVALFSDLQKAYNKLTVPQSAAALAASDLPGSYLPGSYLPGSYLPGSYLPGSYLPGSYLPGGYLPGSYLPGSYLPGSYLPGSYLPGSYLPGSYLPGSYLPGSYLPGSYLQDGYLPELYSGAVRRGLLAYAADGNATTQVIERNTWDLSENMYVQVTGPAALGTPVSVQVNFEGGVCANVPVLPEPAGVGAIIASGAPAPGSLSADTLILWNSARMLASGDLPSADLTAFQNKLASFASRSDVNAVVVDLAEGNGARFPRVTQANTNADANTICVSAKNTAAAEVKRVVDVYRAAAPSTLKHIVLIGSDYEIPFFRYPDNAGLANENEYVPPVADDSASQASLRQGQVLGQDAYGAQTDISRGGYSIPLPKLAVGRLVRTAAQVSGMLDAYVATGGVITPTTSLVTGYDFVADAAIAARAEIYQAVNPTVPVNCGADPDAVPGGCQPVNTLLQPQNAGLVGAWSANALRQQLIGPRHDLVFFAGHFSAGSLLAADYDSADQVLASEVLSPNANFVNTLVLGLGCHSGYNIPRPDGTSASPSPDWPEAFAGSKATFIAATGYAYGDTELTEYGERLYLNVLRQLRRGNGPVAIGQALVNSKIDYLSATASPVGLDDKTVLETTLYGLPMMKVNFGGQRVAVNDQSVITATTPVNAGPGQDIGLFVGEGNSATDITLNATQLLKTVPLVNQDTQSVITASYFTGGAGVVARPAEPILPQEQLNVSVPGKVLRGVGFRGGSYTDNAGITPLTSAATTENSRAHPAFFTDFFYPSQPWSANYYDAADGGSTRLVVATGQYKSDNLDSPSGTLRTHQQMRFRTFYLDQNWINLPLTSPIRLAALAAGPEIVDVAAKVTGSSAVTFSVTVNGDVAASVQDVWVTWTDPAAPGTWQSIDLAPANTARTQWAATATGIPASAVFMVQAVNGAGLVSLASNNGAYYAIAPLTPPPPPPPPAATTLTFDTAPGTGSYGSTVQFSARLLSDNTAVSGKLVQFAIGSQRIVATTDAAGLATAQLRLTQAPGAVNASAVFAAETGLAAASVSAPFTVTRDSTALTLVPAGPLTFTTGLPSGIAAALVDSAGAPIVEKAVVFVAENTTTNVRTVLNSPKTDLNGRATLGATTLAPGAYTLFAYFSGNVPGAGNFDDALYLPASTSRSLTVSQLDPVISWPTPAPITYGTPLGAAQLNASANVSGTFAYTPAAGSVLNTGVQTLSVTFTPASASYAVVTRTVVITVNKATPSITWPTPAPIVLGTPLGAAQLNAGSPVTGSFVYTPAAGTLLPVGTNVLRATFIPADATNYTTATATVNQAVQYAAGGLCLGEPGRAILQPVNADGSSIFKQGRTVQVRFRVCDANGNSIGAPGTVLIMLPTGISTAPAGAVNETAVTLTPDLVFRWDATGRQWVFNLDTRVLPKGYKYAFRITLRDGSGIDFSFSLK